MAPVCEWAYGWGPAGGQSRGFILPRHREPAVLGLPPHPTCQYDPALNLSSFALYNFAPAKKPYPTASSRHSIQALSRPH